MTSSSGAHSASPQAAQLYYNLARLKWNSTAYAVDTTFPQIFNQVVSGAGVQVSAVNAVAVMGTYGSSNVLVGGYNMQVPGDTTHAYHLITFKFQLEPHQAP